MLQTCHCACAVLWGVHHRRLPGHRSKPTQSLHPACWRLCWVFRPKCTLVLLLWWTIKHKKTHPGLTNLLAWSHKAKSIRQLAPACGLWWIRSLFSFWQWRCLPAGFWRLNGTFITTSVVLRVLGSVKTTAEHRAFFSKANCHQQIYTQWNTLFTSF